MKNNFLLAKNNFAPFAEQVNTFFCRYLKCILLLFILGVRSCDIAERHELHPDEVYSVLISQCNESFYHIVPDGSYYGADLKKRLIASHPLGADLERLYHDNADTPHASLYYMMLRVCLSSLDDWSPEQVAWRGGLLNLLFLACSYLLLWHLISLLLRQASGAWICACSCAAAFLSPGAAECAMLVREYQLATLANIAYIISLVYLAKGLTSEKPCVKPLNILAIIVSTTISLSTGYLNSYFLIISPIFIMLWLGDLVSKRQAWSFIWRVAICCLAALILSWCIYLGWFNFLLRPNTHTDKAFNKIMPLFEDGLWRDVICQGLTIPLFIILCMCVVYWLLSLCTKKLRTVKGSSSLSIYTLPVFLAAVVTIMLVQFTSILHESRYSFPFMPFLSLAVPLCLNFLPWQKIKTGAYCIITVYFMIISLFQSPCRNYKWTVQRETLRPGALLHSLNPNEQVILYPCVNDSAIYVVLHDSVTPIWQNQITLTHDAPKATPDSTKSVAFNGPVKAIVPLK